jgi:site-specific recombinase
MKLRLFKRETPGERDRRLLREALDRLVAAADPDRLAALAGLIRTLRPKDRDDAVGAERRVRALTLLVSSDETHRDALRVCLLQQLTEKQWVHLLTDTGILPGETLSVGLWRRIGQKLLPDVVNEQWLSHVLDQLFPRTDDYRWVRGVPDEVWTALLDELEFGALPAADHRPRLLLQFLQALQVISHRIAAIGLEPELVHNHPAIERYESPFLAQSEETRQFIRERQQALADGRPLQMDEKHLLVLLDQCTQIVAKIRRQAEKTGASISLTTLLLRLDQSLLRMRTLLTLIEDRPAHELNTVRVQMFKRLVRGVNRRNSLAELWSQYMGLLAQRIAGNAGRTGEHYVTASRREYFDMLRSALGAGFIVAFMSLNKIWMSETLDAPLIEAFQHSLNYGLGFVLIYMFGFTIATKQPAMTASYLAHSLDAAEGDRHRLDRMVELIVRVSRSQFIAIVGNVAMAFPVALLVGQLIQIHSGTHVAEPGRAAYLLHELHPLASLAIFHAAIAGVWLFVAGLISGYYDNRCVYNRIPQRIRQLRWLKAVAGQRGRERVAAYVEEHLGGIAGNFFFGVMLGSTASLGVILGLPLDIRHIAFATANLAYGLTGLEFGVGGGLALACALGVLLIGLTNLAVSFTLALMVALRARDVEFGETRQLLGLIGRRLLRTPLDFVWPPRDSEPQTAQR